VKERTFTKLRTIGRGGSSSVYRVMAKNYRIFALKRVSLKKASREEQEMYMNEIEFLRKLRNNERIIQLCDYEINLEKGYVIILMEIGEVDLATVLDRWKDRKKNMNFVRMYWEQMLSAVHTIHEEKIVHSDLKPANFLLVRGNLKLIDFGIAKRIANDTTNIRRDQQVGTVNYMSPEALQDTGEDRSIGRKLMKLGRASDVWSLGCILYQMLYGHTPFADYRFTVKLHAIVDESFAINYPEWLEYDSNEKVGETHEGEGEEGKDAEDGEGTGSSEPAGSSERSKIRVKVDVDGIDTIRACLQRDPKQRRSIPQLLQDPLLHPGENRMGVPAVRWIVQSALSLYRTRRRPGDRPGWRSGPPRLEGPMDRVLQDGVDWSGVDPEELDQVSEVCCIY
ncbi:kinase-like domain-containing protein, partial [Piptocephalis cylindrospora]